MQLFYEVIDKEMPVPTVNLRDEDMTAADVIMEQRIHNLKMTSQVKLNAGEITKINGGSDADPLS